jgi:hypothetical protein
MTAAPQGLSAVTTVPDNLTDLIKYTIRQVLEKVR